MESSKTDTGGRGPFIFCKVNIAGILHVMGLLGFVVFANFDSASQPDSRGFKYVNPAAGTGLRIKFNKKSDTNIGIDFAASRNYSTVIFSLGEAF